MAWAWAAASCRGVSHERSGTRKQDAQAVFTIETTAGAVLVCIVSDGAGSATFGGEGASVICRSIALAARRHFGAACAMPTDDMLLEWVDAARDRLLFAASKRALAPREFAATLILSLTSENESIVAHVGDGCAVHRDAATGAWETLLWPDHGEYASTTSFVTNEPPLRVRIARQSAPIDGLAVFSDGIERLALDFKERQPFQPFFEAMARPVAASIATSGRDVALSAHLRAFLNSATVNERTDDDKTLVIAIRK